MTNFAIARRFAKLTPAQLAEKLGVSVQYISQLETGARNLGKNNLAAFAEALDVSPSWLQGTPQHFMVFPGDDSDELFLPLGIVREEIIPGYGILYHCYCDETGDVVPVISSINCVQFTPWNWQNEFDNAHCVDEIPDTKWVDANGNPAIMIDGLPRILG